MKHIEQVANDGATQMSSQQLAMEQIARETVKQAVARWTTGLSAQEAAPPTQARWYEEAHANFMAWVDAGGFSQMEAEPGQAGTAPGRSDGATVPAPENQRLPAASPTPAGPGVICSA
jgi:hypothetical protein